MGRRQDRREDRREDRGPGRGSDGGGKQHYQMRQKIASIGDDFWIENGQGEKVYKIDGKALRVRDTLIFEDRSGNELYKIQERKVRVKDSMEIEDAKGKKVAMVKKALITPVRERWSVDIPGASDMEVQGNILDHEYKIGNVAEVSKKWFRIADSYGVEIEPGQDDALILAVAAVIDMMAHEGR
ncbi:MAG: LURP-one-related family protein [Chloroflexota bacterium]|jgi:uncharacterized protein YxjI